MTAYLLYKASIYGNITDFRADQMAFDCIYAITLKSSLREHTIFSALVSSSSGGREATTGKISPVRRLPKRH